MSNLIITIIAIALTAVAALMAVFYGGQSYMEGQYKAQANSIISAAKQIADAWNLYLVDNGGSVSAALGNFSVLVPKYLQQMPSLSSSLFDPVSTPITNNFYSRSTTILTNGNALPRNIVRIYLSSYELCKAVSQIAGGVGYTPPTMPGTGDVRGLGKRPFDCFWADTNSNGIPDAIGTDSYIFMYLVLQE